jgi:outer membrane protein TolC
LKKKTLITNIFFIALLLKPAICLSQENDLDALEFDKVQIEELFYKKHLNTDFSPIKTDANLKNTVEISISDILATSIENNLNLKMAKQNSKAAKWQFVDSFANMLPDLQLYAAKQKRDGTFYLNSNFQGAIDETISSAGLRLNYRAFNGGASSFLAMAQKYYKKSIEAKEKSSYNLTLLDSVTFYLKLLSANASLNTELKALERAKTNYDLALQYLDSGSGTKFDLLQADASLAKAQEALIIAEANLRKSQIDLAQHLNLPLDRAFKLAKYKIEKIDLIDNNIQFEDFLSSSFANNPDIKSALEHKKAVAKENLAKNSLFLPSLDLYFDVSGTGQEWTELYGVTTLGLSANYNIGEGLGLNALSQKIKAKALYEKAKLEYEQEKQNIEKALRIAYINFQRSKSILEASQKSYKASQEAYRLSLLRYKNGIEIFADLLDHQTDLTKAQLVLITATIDYNISQARLLYDMGEINPQQILASGL